MSSFSDEREAKALFQQLSPAGWKDIIAAYRHATVGRGHVILGSVAAVVVALLGCCAAVY